MSGTTIALVTGASRGLGRNMAQHLARAGVGVIGTYQRSREEADQLVTELQQSGVPAAALPLDVSNSSSFGDFASAVQQTLAGFGAERLDALVNNAGTGVYASFADTTEAQFDEMVAIQLKGPYFLTQALLPLIADGGRILNVSSGLARFTGPGYAAYATMKGAIEVLTRYQAAELGHRQIRVNTLVPGVIATDFGGGIARDNAQVNQALAETIALGRVGLPDDIGAAVPAILSDAFGWATGTRIELSGGQNL